MKRNVLFFIFHIGSILIFSVFLCIKAYNDVNGSRNKEIPILTNSISALNNNTIFFVYQMISGTNTGYGFFGTSVATQKIITVEIFDRKCVLLHKGEDFNFQTFVGKGRFKGYPIHLSGFIDETNKMRKDVKSDLKLIALREKYIEKVFKNLGKCVSNKITNSNSYKISLKAVIPMNIWNKKRISKNIVYVEKVYQYDVI